MALTDLFSNVPKAPSFPGGNSNINPLTAVTNARGYLDTLANAYILKPANAKGIGGFVFDYEGDTEIVVQAEITDHYTEQNTFINDQAAQKPQKITLRGFVGELSLNPNQGVLGALNTLQAKLTTLPAILGKYTPAITQKIAAGIQSVTNTVNKIDNAISRVQNVVGLIAGGSPAATRQQKAYQQLYALWANNTVFTLETPFNYFRSVMIEHMMFVQDETTKQWSEITVTVKEVRFLQSPSSIPGVSQTLAKQNLAGRLASQGQALSNQGKAAGVQASFSNLFSSFGHVTASGLAARAA